MSSIKLDEDKLSSLYALAKKATRGPWKVCKYLGQRSDEWSVSLDTDKGQGIAIVQTMYEHKNAAYVAAVSPDVVTALIDETKSQKAEIARLREALVQLETLADRIDETMTNYERMGEVCSFEGQPMIYASILEELSDQARAALNKE